MVRAWLKPFGDSRQSIRDDWTHEFLPDPLRPLELMTGRDKRHSPPPMQRGDRVLLHAVGHMRLFAEGQLLSEPKWTPDADTGWDPKRWPWIYKCQVNVWVPLVSRGPRTWDVVPRPKGTIQFGRPYAALSADEYERLLAALLNAPTVTRRPPA
jgi:hypothetical protein